MSDTLVLDDFDQLGIPPADAALAVAIYTKLQEHYPGHNWRTYADHEQGIAGVFLQYINGTDRNGGKHGFRLKIARLNGDPTMQCVVRAGGELLERFGLPRHAYRVDRETWERALQHGMDLTR